MRRLLAFFFVLATLPAAFAPTPPALFAFDDEPNELNWDRLGGTATSFRHFCAFAKQNPDFRRKLLDEQPENAFDRPTNAPQRPTTIWVKASAFLNYKANQWTPEQVDGEDVLSYPAGHGGGFARAKIDVPKSGYYRIWTRYHHSRGTTSTFVLRLEDPRVFEFDNMYQTVVGDVFSWRFDAAEMGRRNDPLPTRRDEPTGWIWESAPTVWLEKGERVITLTGTICDGPFAPRRVAAVVLTEEPLAEPTWPKNGRFDPQSGVCVGTSPLSDEAKKVAGLWRRRPVSEPTNAELARLWSVWRDAFFADLAEYRVPGIEGRRTASLVAFDPTSNLIGTPRQLRDEKARIERFIADFPRDAFLQLLEAEDFTLESGWWVDGNADASGGRILTASYGDGAAAATYVATVPKAGTYRFWARYLELPGYLSKFRVKIESVADESKSCEIELCADEATNKTSPGFRWTPLTLELPAGEVRLSLTVNGGPGLTYRRFDCVVATDKLDWTPPERGAPELIAPFPTDEKLTVWRVDDPFAGFSRLSAPKRNENLAPFEVELPQESVKTILLLARNATDAPITVCPQIANDPAGLLSWRVPAFSFSPEFGWQPSQLLERSALTIPPRQTAGIWLTLDGDKPSGDETISLKIDDANAFVLNVLRKGNLSDAPRPYVGGWSAPYETVSCWETFAKLGLNTINGALVSQQEAEKYGIRLFLHLNDGDVSTQHIAGIAKYFADFNIPCENWAWSFMDEPGNGAADAWVDLAKQFIANKNQNSETAPIRIWCNPGEIEGAAPESVLKMAPYIDCYCPFANHYWTKGWNNADYLAVLEGKDRERPIRLCYTTPCFGEKAPGSPGDMFGPAATSLDNNLDGWMFYALLGRYEYCNSVWDEANAYVPDQAIYLYPGAEFRTISTRNAEAIRAAVDHWRSERLKKATAATP